MAAFRVANAAAKQQQLLDRQIDQRPDMGLLRQAGGAIRPRSSSSPARPTATVMAAPTAGAFPPPAKDRLAAKNRILLMPSAGRRCSHSKVLVLGADTPVLRTPTVAGASVAGSHRRE
jgi:hypothetical protein